jgi:hypothetical protein
VLALLALALAAARPLPDPSNPDEGERATQCVLLYRLRTPDVPTDSAACEDAGYGLEFMRERDGEIRALEQRHTDELAQAKDRSRARTSAKAQRATLQGPCIELALGTGPGPDGGAEVCALAGWSPTQVSALLARERAAANAKDGGKPSAIELGLGLVAAGLGLGALRWFRRSAKR